MQLKSAKVLRDLLNSGKTVMAPGAYDGLSSRLVSLAGFDAVYA
ncbi:MAG: isocitrate lyase, partial [Cytophagaceae bacterium]